MLPAVYFPYGVELKQCGNETCAFGSVCVSEAEGKCSCDGDCPPDTLGSPVCADDGNTYRSECQLLQYACRYKKHILIKSYTPCKGQYKYSA
jgi:coxsackievirus/adenovirus receptor